MAGCCPCHSAVKHKNVLGLRSVYIPQLLQQELKLGDCPIKPSQVCKTRTAHQHVL